MKRFLACAAIAGLAFASTAQAGTANNNFTVSTSLTSMCTATNSGTATVDFGTYVAFQAGIQGSTTVNLLFQCTRGLTAPTVAFDTGSGLGVVAGLQYTLTAAAAVFSAGTAATTATIGTGDGYSYGVSGSMPAGQAGTCAAASCPGVTAARILIVTF